MSIKDDSPPEVFLEKFPETIPEITDSLVVQICFGNLTGFAKTDDEKYIFCPSPSSRLVACTMNERFDRRSFSDIESPYPFGA